MAAARKRIVRVVGAFAVATAVVLALLWIADQVAEPLARRALHAALPATMSDRFDFKVDRVGLGQAELTGVRYDLASLRAGRVKTLVVRDLAIRADWRNGTLDLGGLDTLLEPPDELEPSDLTVPDLPFQELRIEGGRLLVHYGDVELITPFDGRISQQGEGEMLVELTPQIAQTPVHVASTIRNREAAVGATEPAPGGLSIDTQVTTAVGRAELEADLDRAGMPTQARVRWRHPGGAGVWSLAGAEQILPRPEHEPEHDAGSRRTWRVELRGGARVTPGLEPDDSLPEAPPATRPTRLEPGAVALTGRPLVALISSERVELDGWRFTVRLPRNAGREAESDPNLLRLGGEFRQSDDALTASVDWRLEQRIDLASAGFDASTPGLEGELSLRWPEGEAYPSVNGTATVDALEVGGPGWRADVTQPLTARLEDMHWRLSAPAVAVRVQARRSPRAEASPDTSSSAGGQWATDPVSVTASGELGVSRAGVDLAGSIRSDAPIAIAAQDWALRAASAIATGRVTWPFTSPAPRAEGELQLDGLEVDAGDLAIGSTRLTLPYAVGVEGDAPAEPTGSFRVARWNLGGRDWPEVTGRIDLWGDRVRFDATSDLPLDVRLVADGVYQPLASSARVNLNLPTFQLENETSLGEYVPALADITLTGRFGASGAVIWQDDRLDSTLQTTIESADVNSLSQQASARNVNGRVKLISLAPLVTSASQELKIETIRVGNLALNNGLVAFRIEPTGTVFIERSRWSWGDAGDFRVHAFRFEPESPTIRFEVFLEALDLRQWLQFFDEEQLDGSGELFGRLEVAIRTAPTLRVRDIDGFLYAKSGKGTIQVKRTEEIRQVLDQTAAGGDLQEVVKQRIVEGLRNFEYDMLRFEVDGDTLRIQTSGKGREGAQQEFGNLTVNLNGFTDAVNRALEGQQLFDHLESP